MKKTILGLVVLLAIGLVYYFQVQRDTPPLKIGAILPLTGDVASYGLAVKSGIDLALDEVNKAGGVRGRKIQILYEDDRADPKVGVSIITRFVSIDKVPAIIGAVPSGVTLAIAPIAESNHVVLLSPASSAPRITSAGDYIFRNYPSDDLEGTFVAQFAVARKFNTAAVVTANTEYGTGLNDVFSTDFVRAGGMVVLNERYQEGTSDFRTTLTKISALDPACIFIAGYSKELGTMVKQARELGVKSQFLSTVNFYDQQSLTTGEAAVNGVIFSSPMFDPASSVPAMRTFAQAYRARLGKDPDVWSAHGYDALQLLVYAMKSNGLTADDIKSGLYAIKDFEGASGTTTFDRNGDVIKPVRFLTVDKGKFVPLQP